MGKVKNNSIIKIMILLLITIIILISLVGIYVKKTYQYENILPDYKLGMEFTGSRITQIKVSDAENQVAYDAEGNIVEDYEEGQEGITVVTEKVNKDEVLTEENFKKVKEIIQKRLKQTNIQEYELRVNMQTGDIMLELPESIQTDTILSGVYPAGKFEIVDAETGEVLLTKEQIKDSVVMYEATTTGTQVYLAIQFDKEGTVKLEEISKTYIATQDEEGNTVEKQISVKIDDEDFTTTYFGSTIPNGQLNIPMGHATEDTEELGEYINQTALVAAILSNETMPIIYEVESSSYFPTEIKENTILLLEIIVVALNIIIIIYFSIRYKLNGLFGGIIGIGFGALLLLAIRFSNVVITIEALIVFFMMMLLNYLFIQVLLAKLNKENTKQNFYEVLKRALLTIIPFAIVAVILCFQGTLAISTSGMIMFWGLVIFALYHLGITKVLLTK